MVSTNLIDITSQTKQHRKQPLEQLVHWWQTVLPLHHLSTLPHHVDHQAVEQLTSCYLHRTESGPGYNSPVFLLADVSLYRMTFVNGRQRQELSEVR